MNDLQKLYLQEIQNRASKDLNFFSQEIIGKKINQVLSKKEKELGKKLYFDNAPFHKEWYSYLQDEANKKIIVLAPRGHSKSVSFTNNFPLWSLAKNPNLRIVIASNTSSQAQGFLRDIVSHIEENQYFKDCFGNLKSKDPIKWTDNEIIVQRNQLMKDPSISCVGTSGAVLSKRADIIICDDILDEENTATSNQRQKVKNWFHSVLMPVLEPEGRLVIVGTRWHFNDLYSEFLKDDSFDVRKVYRAIKEDGTPLWKERFSLEELEKRKKSAGSVIFSQQYQNEPMSEDTALFPRKNIKFYNPDDINLDELSIFGAIDPAISQKETADYSAFITIGVDEDGKIYVLDVARGHYSPTQLIDIVLDKYKFYKHSSIGFEVVAFQRVLKDELDRVSAKRRIYVPTTELKADKDKKRRATKLVPYFENGLIFLKENQENLIDELTSFPLGKHDDTVDALAYSVSLIQENPEPQLFIFNV